jgi:hypothetical protein
MSEGSDISVLYREFAAALTGVLAENAVGPARRGRLARARATISRSTLGLQMETKNGVRPCKSSHQ